METLVTKECSSGKGMSPREKKCVTEIRRETALWKKGGMVLWMKGETVVLIWYVVEPNKSRLLPAL